MKKLLILLVTTSLFSCSKDETPTLHGDWKLVKACDVYGCSSIEPGYNFNVHFNNNGNLNASGSWTKFHDYERYEIIDGETVRFYNSTGDYNDAHFSFESGLCLSFFNARCGDWEYFIRMH